MKSNSTINYMDLVKAVLPVKNVLEAVIKKAFDNYGSRKEFFHAQTSGR